MSVDPLENRQWDEPGCFEVAPGVYRMPLPLPNDGLRAVNVYAIIDGDRLVVIDSGQHLAEARAVFAAALVHIGATFADISQFLVTHIHRDHYTQAVALRREFGMSIALGEDERTSIEHAARPTRSPLREQLVELERCGARDLVAKIGPSPGSEDIAGSLYEEPDRWLKPGRLELTTRVLDVLPTPGHTRGHVVFFDHEHRLFFAGDHVLPHITPSIGFEPTVYPNPLGNYLDSLRRVRHFPQARLLPAHGMPNQGFHERVDELLEHHDVRLNATIGAIEQGAATPFEVAALVKWTRRERRFDELDTFNQMLAVMETKYHLELLAVQGRLRLVESDGLYRYFILNP